MFFKQKGFYISLACGIAAIGAFAALCINMNRSEQKEPVALASNPPQATAVATPETKEASSNHANSEVKEKKTKKFIPPTLEEIKKYCEEICTDQCKTCEKAIIV